MWYPFPVRTQCRGDESLGRRQETGWSFLTQISLGTQGKESLLRTSVVPAWTTVGRKEGLSGLFDTMVQETHDSPAHGRHALTGWSLGITTPSWCPSPPVREVSTEDLPPHRAQGVTALQNPQTFEVSFPGPFPLQTASLSPSLFALSP